MNRNALQILSALVLAGLIHANASAQQRSVSKEPIRVVDASTGKTIPEVLMLPQYSTFRGISTILGEGPGRGTTRYYIARPYLYRSGTPFKQKLPKSFGLMVPVFLFVGKGRTLEGVLVVAPGYRPEWFIDFWVEKGEERTIRLTPISNEEWAAHLEKVFSPLEGDARLIEDHCGFWDLPAPCKLEIHYNKKERALVRSFLRGKAN